jgi:hypothetical protein
MALPETMRVERKERFMREYDKFLSVNDLSEHEVNCYGIIEDWIDYIETEIALRDAHHKALRAKELGEIQEMFKTDFTTAWKVLITKKENHHEKCSWRQAGMLCDCAGQDVFIAHAQYLRAKLDELIEKPI